MSEAEAGALYHQILSMLQEPEVGLGWVSNQIRSTIREGKLTWKKRDLSGDEVFVLVDESTARFPKEVRGDVTTEEYSNKEKLAMLMDGIERVAIQPYEMYLATRTMWTERLRSIEGSEIAVRFESDDEAGHSWSMEADEAVRLSSWSASVGELISEVRQELHGN